MSILESSKLALPLAIASVVIFCHSNSSNTTTLASSEAKLMAQNSNKGSSNNEIRLPDNVLKQIEEMERKARQEQADAFARDMARKTPKEREAAEKERKRLKEVELAPEVKTDEELRREDERAIKVLRELKAKKKSE
ncbi:MAG: hypothetical protein KME59_16080 [Trichormus sp. ATA11-4-KO1]|jgi:hypothetical protein|nr:hypothetical protein [Trichormus sp. ATA11-4-KO1]